jgi:hypothetical protein
LGRVCILAIVHLNAPPLEAIPVLRKTETIKEVLATD